MYLVCFCLYRWEAQTLYCILKFQEAIMVLHNRIKEFEGLIQYIEVQASYETSEERLGFPLLFIVTSQVFKTDMHFQVSSY